MSEGKNRFIVMFRKQKHGEEKKKKEHNINELSFLF